MPQAQRHRLSTPTRFSDPQVDYLVDIIMSIFTNDNVTFNDTWVNHSIDMYAHLGLPQRPKFTFSCNFLALQCSAAATPSSKLVRTARAELERLVPALEATQLWFR